MKSSLNYIIPILTLVIGIAMGMNRCAPVYEVTEIVLENEPDTIRMSLSGCLDMVGG